MALNDGIYKFHSMAFSGPDFNTTTVLGGLTTTAVSRNPNVVQEFTDGNVFPTITSLQAFQDDLQFTTLNIDTLIDVLGVTASCIKPGNKIDIYYGLESPCDGGFSPGSVHRKLTITSATRISAIAVLQTITSNHQENATATFMIKPQFDGTNVPIQITTNVALPSGPFDNGNRYKMGPSTIGGVVIEGKKSISFNNAPSEQRESADGEIYDELVSISQYAPQTEVSGINLTWADSDKISLEGRACTHTDTSFVLRRELPGGVAGFVARTEPSHIVITQSGVAIPTNVASTSVNAPAESAFTIYSTFDGTNTPVIALTEQTY